MERSRNLPVHDFRMVPGETVPFEILPIERSTRFARAKFPHRHSFYEILYVTGGEGAHVIDFEPYPLQPNTLYFISPGQVHFWELKTPLEGPALVFTEDFLLLTPANRSVVDELAFFHSMANSPELRLTTKQAANINTLFQTIEYEYRSDEFGRTSALRAHLHILLVQIQRIYEAARTEAESTKESSLVRRFKQQVSENFISERSARTYANRLGVSLSHLSDTIKALTGRTPGQIIRQEIALEAKRLLAHSDLTVAEIGYSLGFEDPSYFGRFFKREVGVSPNAFRGKFREKYQISPD